MSKILVVILLSILLFSCTRTWDEATHATMHRDARSNLFSGDSNMIYIGVGTDKDEAYLKKVFETSIFYKGAQHVAPKEQIAQQQCIKTFGFSKPNFIEMISFDKEKKKEFRLFYAKYAKYYCEPK